MSAYIVTVLPAAVRQLRRLDRPAQARLTAAMERLATDPRPDGVRALSGHPGLLRIRIGDYRVVYTVQDAQLVVLVVALGHRREVYRQV